MATTSQIRDWVNDIAPWDTMMEWDKSGPQVFFEKECHRILVCMDVTDASIEKAVEKGCDLILSHHPFFFSSLSSWREGDAQSENLRKLLEHKISVLSAHTNLDCSEEGVNVATIEALGFSDEGPFGEEQMGRIADVGDVKWEDFEHYLKERLCPRIFHLWGGKPERIQKIAILGGAGVDALSEAKEEGVDLFITGDVKHHDGQRAYEMGLPVLDIGHYDSEKSVLFHLKHLLEERFDLEALVFDENPYLIF